MTQVIETKTASGTPVKITVKSYKTVIVDVQGYSAAAEWGRSKDGKEGLMIYIKKNGKNITACVVLPRTIKTQIDAIQAEMIEAIKTDEITRSTWAIVFSGRYLVDAHLLRVINTGRTDKNGQEIYETTQFCESFDIRKLRNTDLFDRLTETSVGAYQREESMIFTISDDEKSEIENELKKIENAKIEAVRIEREAEETRTEAAKQKAAETGKKVILNTGTTGRCMNGGYECSMDTWTTYVHPDGKIDTKYTCCH
jgi:hypothetical protein